METVSGLLFGLLLLTLTASVLQGGELRLLDSWP
jgi:hypothetical protein